MSKCTNNDINISSSTNVVDDDIFDDIEKLTTADDDQIISGEEEGVNSEKKCTSCEQKLEHIETDNTSSNYDNVDQDIDNTGSNLEVSDICASCGKEGASNTCNKCKMVKYCNAACKKRHRHKHKKDCEEHVRRVAELEEEENKRAAELHEIELFKQPPQKDEECPICFQRLPYVDTGKRYQACCGKLICSGCIHAPVYDNQGNARDNKICPFCRIQMAELDDEDIVKGVQKRVDAGDAESMCHFGIFYSHGMHGLSRDYAKALDLFHRAAELGLVGAYNNIGNAYYAGNGVERDMKKALHYWEVAAMRGNVDSRHNLGFMEEKAGNMDRAIRHYLISVRSGYHGSLKNVQQHYSNGYATKDEYTEALRAYQNYLSEVKSRQRDEAAAAREDYKYI